MPYLLARPSGPLPIIDIPEPSPFVPRAAGFVR